jgi:hypothetical protein
VTRHAGSAQTRSALQEKEQHACLQERAARELQDQLKKMTLEISRCQGLAEQQRGKKKAWKIRALASECAMQKHQEEEDKKDQFAQLCMQRIDRIESFLVTHGGEGRRSDASSCDSVCVDRQEQKEPDKKKQATATKADVAGLGDSVQALQVEKAALEVEVVSASKVCTSVTFVSLEHDCTRFLLNRLFFAVGHFVSLQQSYLL